MAYFEISKPVFWHCPVFCRKTWFTGIYILFILILYWPTLTEARLTEEQLAPMVIPPMKLGNQDESLPIWQVLNSGGALIGYIFETNEITPVSGFSGSPMNLLVVIDTNGSFLDVKVLDQNEPVFVSGLGARPFHEFVRQYRDQSLASNIKILPAKAKRPDTANAGLSTYFDGITKATASVRIANDAILASALSVAREKLANIIPKPAARPRQDLFDPMQWQQLVERGLIKNLIIYNRDVQKAFANTLYSDDDEEALDDPDGLYLDIWIADLGLPSISQNIMSSASLETLKEQLKDSEEPILLLANGRHQLVGEDFVRNSIPDRMDIRQQGFSISFRDADADMEFLPSVPEFEQAMILRVDTRYGFDPSSEWTFIIKAIRKHGFFQPAVGSTDLIIPYKLDERYFEKPQQNLESAPPWLTPWIDKKVDLLALIIYLSVLSYFLHWHRRHITLPQRLNSLRFGLLLITLVFIGWIEQGQLSIVTLLGFIRAVFETFSFTFLLYDPISLTLWLYVLITLFLWGRGTFCGWLCPFGALQEFAHQLGRKLGIRELNINQSLSNKMGWIKYFILAGLVASTFLLTDLTDQFVEVEPFKTAITLTFQRSWPYVIYALICIMLSVFIFKAYCRFLCPLGAALAIGGKLRMLDWLIRREECGTPCKLCSVQCRYEAIVRHDGSIKYHDCFQCFECVEIYDDEKRCVPLVQVNKKLYKKSNEPTSSSRR